MDFSKRLKTARQLRGFSMADLVGRLSVPLSRQSIAKYEAGDMYPSPSVAEALCKALDVSWEMLSGQKQFQFSSFRLRTGAGGEVGPELLERYEELTRLWLDGYLLQEENAGMTSSFENPLKGFQVETKENVERAAEELRAAWNLGSGLIPHFLRLLERKGIHILDTPLPEKVYGTSTWADGRYPLMILTMDPKVTTTERLRFTAAHELGHLLLDLPDDAPIKCVERFCNQFAGCLLIPPETLREELGTQRDFLTIEELSDLHIQYGVSVAAIVHEAFDLDIISRNVYDFLFEEYIKKNTLEVGWGTYLLPETLGREQRIKSITHHKNHLL